MAEVLKRGIVITTSEHTKDWLPECLESLGNKYPILVVGNNYGGERVNVVNDWNGFELGGILRGAEHFDEFIHLMDTCIVKDQKMFDEMFEHKGSVYLCDGFFSYLGKYRKEILDKVGIPKINNKADAIALENSWNRKYLDADPNAVQYLPELPIHTGVFVEKHGRKNMVLDNGAIVKFKGTWSL